MKITPKILEGIYLTLAKCDPFTKWDLPPSELCRFGIVDDHSVMATYEYDESLARPHIFHISKARCGFFDTCVRSMANAVARWRAKAALEIIRGHRFLFFFGEQRAGIYDGQ